MSNSLIHRRLRHWFERRKGQARSGMFVFFFLGVEVGTSACHLGSSVTQRSSQPKLPAHPHPPCSDSVSHQRSPSLWGCARNCETAGCGGTDPLLSVGSLREGYSTVTCVLCDPYCEVGLPQHYSGAEPGCHHRVVEPEEQQSAGSEPTGIDNAFGESTESRTRWKGLMSVCHQSLLRSGFATRFTK